MRLIGSVVVLLLARAPVLAQTPFLGDVQTWRAQYPTPMSPAQLGELMNRLAWVHRAEGWGVLAKPSGNQCPHPSGPIACDILVHQPSGTHWDVLTDQEETATPVFHPKGPIDLSRFIAPVDPGGAAPPPLPPATPDYRPIYEWLLSFDARDEQRYQDLVRRDERGVVLHEGARGRDEALAAQLTQHDTEPTWFGKIIRHPLVQMGLAAGGTWLTTYLSTKHSD